jgi:rod shape-determining protein MreC
MISASQASQASTVRILSVTVFYPLQMTLNQIKRIENIFAENRRLKMDNAHLSTQIAVLREQSVENVRLRGMLNFKDDYSYQLVPARVVARDPSSDLKSFIINVGSKDSILKYMPLVTEKGVVGKVVQVMNGLSLVQLLKDPSNRTSVMSGRTRAVSILETDNGKDFFIRYRNHEDIVLGDSIITSGLGGIYPKGLQVGIVSKTTESRDPLFKKVWLKLSVDFEHVEELFVVRLSPQWSSFQTELDSIEF